MSSWCMVIRDPGPRDSARSAAGALPSAGARSRSVAVEVREKGRRIAAELLEAAGADVVPVQGGFQVTGAARAACHVE